MKILVTGATGFIGSYLCKRLIKDGHEVIGLSYSGDDSRLRELRSKNFSLRVADIRDEQQLDSIFNGEDIESVFHLASQVPYTHYPQDAHNVNSNGTLHMVNLSQHYGVKRFVYASSMSIYSVPPLRLPVTETNPTKPLDIYGRTKLIGEFYCRSSLKLEVTILRYAGVYGKYSDTGRAIPTFFEYAIKDEPLIVNGDKAKSSDFVYIDDVIQGTMLAWEKGGNQTYNIGSGQETTLKSLAEKIVKLTFSKSIVVLSESIFERSFRFYLDISKAQKELGYSPLPLDEGLRKYADSIR